MTEQQQRLEQYLREFKMWWNGDQNGIEWKMNGWDLRNLSFKDKIIEHVEMIESFLDNSDLRNSKFIDCHMPNASFVNCDVRAAIFKNCDLRGADFTNLTFDKNSFQFCDLSGAIMDNTIIGDYKMIKY